ncbi:MAG: UMP kinase [Candidatus Diapherotrites archaeon]|uniref:Uridylate kinase n=1 Tax=Candidatus Iainarchaeum sp. TaxID=3101447 RepID=A0A8T4KTZ3_9ARCH|nr:UMP kinase [Candidatus Diapherotrites archaeon]
MFEMFQNYNEPAQQHQGAGPSNQTFVLSVSGSSIVPDKINTALIGKICNSINNLYSEGYKFALSVGGGKTCRDYASAVKALGSNRFLQDLIGIEITRANAMLVINALDRAFPVVLSDLLRAREIIDAGKIPVYGGIIPGYTTDAVAAVLAEHLNATFINITNVDGIYNLDPRISRSAKLIPKMSHEKLLAVIMRSAGESAEPGQNVVLDIPCALLLKRSKIRTFVLNAEDTANLEAAVRGQEFKGTIVESADAENDVPEEL